MGSFCQSIVCPCHSKDSFLWQKRLCQMAAGVCFLSVFCAWFLPGSSNTSPILLPTQNRTRVSPRKGVFLSKKPCYPPRNKQRGSEWTEEAGIQVICSSLCSDFTAWEDRQWGHPKLPLKRQWPLSGPLPCSKDRSTAWEETFLVEESKRIAWMPATQLPTQNKNQESLTARYCHEKFKQFQNMCNFSKVVGFVICPKFLVEISSENSKMYSKCLASLF